MKTVIEMAREAGFFPDWNWDRTNWHAAGFSDSFERFAALVAAAERERIIAQNAPEIEKINAHIKTLEKALEDEREAIAKMVEDWDSDSADPRDIAAAIRARGQS